MKTETHSSKSTHKKGDLINYQKRGETGVHRGRILYIGEDVIKISASPLDDDAYQLPRNKKHGKRGSWFFLNEIKILETWT